MAHRALYVMLFSLLGSMFGSFVVSCILSWLRNKSRIARRQNHDNPIDRTHEGRRQRTNRFDSIFMTDRRLRQETDRSIDVTMIKKATAGMVEKEINDHTLSKSKPFVKLARSLIEKIIRTHFEDETIQVHLQGSVRKGTGIRSSDLDCFAVRVAASESDRQEIAAQVTTVSEGVYKALLGRKRILLSPVNCSGLPSIDLIFQNLNGLMKRRRQPDPISRLGKDSRHTAQIITKFLKWMPHPAPFTSSLLGGYEGLQQPNHHIEAFVRLVVLDLTRDERRIRLAGSGGLAALLETCLQRITNPTDEQKADLQKAGLNNIKWTRAATTCLERLSQHM